VLWPFVGVLHSPGKEAVMRLVSHSSLIVMGCCLTAALFNLRALADDQGGTETNLIAANESTEDAPPKKPEALPQQADIAPALPAESPPSAAPQPPASAPRVPKTAAVSRANPRPRAGAHLAAPIADVPITNQARQALGFYGGYSAQATLNQMPRRAPVQPNPQMSSARHQAKPFGTARSEPTVSPYLNLFRDERNSGGIPNYFAYVRPQMDQLEANQTQQRELQQLRGRLQNMPAANTAMPQSYGGPRPAAHYMDTAQFYRSFRR
jgi:hypothetical protein